jgi:chemotaxis protein MotB
MAGRNDQPLLVKKVKKGHGHGHHGGAWKIAYADFATAMMAFFLLLWLLNATTEEKRLGIANFFMPTPFVKNDMVGSSGVSGGQTPNDPGQLDSPP